jgi:glutamate carboxypeptidase
MNRPSTSTRRQLLSLVAFAALLPQGTVSAQSLDSVERAVSDWTDAHVEEAIDLLETVVNINSGTLNPEGVRQVGEIFKAELDALGFATRWTDPPSDGSRAGHVFAERSGDRGRSVLMIGHLDTVFEEEHPFQRFTREGSRARGPGVDDMKGGDVVLLYALKALHHAGALDGAAITVALIGDEESPGDPLSEVRGELIAAGRKADVALGFEGGIRDEAAEYATVARRSASGWTLEVFGKQGHSSQVFSEELGAGAINETARILSAFYEQVRGEEYLTFNAGTILGGTDVTYDEQTSGGTAFGKTNVVPQRVLVRGGIRTISDEQLQRAREAMREIVEQNLPGTTARISFTEGYPAMAPTEGNYALMRQYSQVSEDLGYGALEVLDPGRRGAADISFVAPYTTALAGMGPVGAGAHSPSETLDLDSLAPAIKRAAVLLYRLTRPQPVL